MTNAEVKRYATLICNAIQDGTPFARANAALARERARKPVKQLRGGLEAFWKGAEGHSQPLPR